MLITPNFSVAEIKKIPPKLFLKWFTYFLVS